MLKGQVAVLRLHAASASHVTDAAYSCLRGVYVLQSTKCCGALHRPFGERMVVSIPGQGDLDYPPPIGSSGPATPHSGSAHNTISYLSGPCSLLHSVWAWGVLLHALSAKQRTSENTSSTH